MSRIYKLGRSQIHKKLQMVYTLTLGQLKGQESKFHELAIFFSHDH